MAQVRRARREAEALTVAGHQLTLTRALHARARPQSGYNEKDKFYLTATCSMYSNLYSQIINIYSTHSGIYDDRLNCAAKN